MHVDKTPISLIIIKKIEVKQKKNIYIFYFYKLMFTYIMFINIILRIILINLVYTRFL